MSKECVLYDRVCSNCGECEICDLNNNKICNNCGKCIDEINPYRSIALEDFIKKQEDKEKLDNTKK
ncbi:MAG: hypothetical protein N3I35_11325 [Clostridia bacterium]|nr:hypothetical protein [Clostridia bacterium]